uniref:Lysosomal membrane ascorbate-dependent ferrireductase CYB561A3 n=1 Tax=Zosterops lateralis melanops TaxID=1220523 RepID=A0A8D2NS54_ZOSLA
MAAPCDEEGAVAPRCHHRPTAMLDVPFPPFCAFLGALGLLCVAMVGTWCQHWRGGFSLDGSSRTFNWHPVLMVTGLVVLYGAAALVYRIPNTWSGPKLPWKVLHGSLALGAFVLTVLGLAAVFCFHNAQGTPNMYSLHSWMGLATVLLFSCQVGIPPGSPNPSGIPSFSPIHVFFGSAILMLSVASCASGLNEKLFFSLKNGTTQYKLLPAEAVFANTLGLLILIFGVLVVAALARPSWKRPDSDSLDSHLGSCSAPSPLLLCPFPRIHPSTPCPEPCELCSFLSTPCVSFLPQSQDPCSHLPFQPGAMGGTPHTPRFHHPTPPSWHGGHRELTG